MSTAMETSHTRPRSESRDSVCAPWSRSPRRSDFGRRPCPANPRRPSPPGAGRPRTASGDLEPAPPSVDGVSSEILLVSAAMARDPGIVNAAEENLDRRLPTAHAVSVAFDDYCAKLEALGGYMAERARTCVISGIARSPFCWGADARHPRSRLPVHSRRQRPRPADTAMLGSSDVVGSAHRRRRADEPHCDPGEIPRISGRRELRGTSTCWRGKTVMLDGTTGEVIVDPGEMRERGGRAVRGRRSRLRPRVDPAAPGTGHPSDCRQHRHRRRRHPRRRTADSEGVGLFRTEFCISAADAPTLDEQAPTYTSVLEQFAGRKVVVRTLDQRLRQTIAVPRSRREENPALGSAGCVSARSIPDVLATQFDALGAAAATHRRRSVGDGADGSDGRGSERLCSTRPFAGIAKVGAMIEIPLGSVASDGYARAPRFRQYRDQRSEPVHLRRGSDGGRSGATARPVAVRRPGSDRHGRHGGRRRRRNLSASAGNPRPTRVGAGSGRFGRHESVDGRSRHWAQFARNLAPLDLAVCKDMAAAARGARNPLEGRAAVARIRESA